MTAPVPLCGACESELRLVCGHWVCPQSACPLYGREQIVMPDAPPMNQTQRQEGMNPR